MTSGSATLVIENGAGTVQLTNSESFGDDAKPLRKVEFDGSVFGFEAIGGSGALTARLKLDAGGNVMKGTGKYEGFGFHFEVRRAK